MYSQEIADKVCAELAKGETSLRAVCRNIGIAHSTVLEWARDNVEGFADQYTRARDLATDAEFEGFVDLSDTEPERDEKGRVDPGWVAWHKQRLDSRKWAWARRMPKKYGDKITQEHTGANGGPIIINGSSTDAGL